MRKQKWLLLGLVLILVLVWLLPKGIHQLVNAGEKPLAGITILLDPGHGGVDGGAVSQDGVLEKEIALAIALQLRDYLQQGGALVYLTREGDYDLADPEITSLRSRKRQDLQRRASMVEAVNADLLVTIHLNAMKSNRWRGAQTFYYSDDEESKRLAQHIQSQLITHLQNTNRQIEGNGDLYLLRTSTVPTALVEAGFISNPEEAKLLQQNKYQQRVAFAVYEGILSYLLGSQGEPNH